MRNKIGFTPKERKEKLGGEPHKQFVTDDKGKAVWEDRLAYEKKYKTVTGGPEGEQLTFVKIADAAPNLTEGDTMYVWLSNQTMRSIQVEVFPDGWMAQNMVIATHKPNVSLMGMITFPEAGLYVADIEKQAGFYIAGIAFDPEATEPEITYNGTTSIVHKIDPKFVPCVEFRYLNVEVDGQFFYTVNCTYEEFKYSVRNGASVIMVTIDLVTEEIEYVRHAIEVWHKNDSGESIVKFDNGYYRFGEDGTIRVELM